MRFHLCHVQTLLKKAYARAKDQVEDGNTRYRESLRKDIGHEAAYQQAVAALDGGEGAADDYAKFLFQAKKYLELRGVPMFAFHKTAVERYYYYIRGHKAVRTNGPGSGVEIGTRSLLVAEEALIKAGIPLYEPTSKRALDASYGVVVAPATGEVSASHVSGKDARTAIQPGDSLFDILAWVKPSMRRTVKVIAEVGGIVGEIKVKVGNPVDKDKTVLLRLKDPWISVSQTLPCRIP